MSAYSLTLSVAVIAILGALFFAMYRAGHRFEYMLIAVFILTLCTLALIYMPLSLTLKKGVLTVARPLWYKDIPVSQIESVRLCPPTMGARRIIGSGGFMGYWGWFREGDIGRYFAYYGKASDCFLVTLKDGRKYMLGCKDAPRMAAAIQSELGK